MKNYLYELFEKAANKLDYLKDVDIVFSVPKQESHGDYSTNAAMLLTKILKKNPRDIAAEIIENLNDESNYLDKIEIAGPGFVNFYFKS